MKAAAGVPGGGSSWLFRVELYLQTLSQLLQAYTYPSALLASLASVIPARTARTSISSSSTTRAASALLAPARARASLIASRSSAIATPSPAFSTANNISRVRPCSSARAVKPSHSAVPAAVDLRPPSMWRVF